MLEKGLNFRTQKGQEDYFRAYDESLKLWNVEFKESYVETSFGKTHCIISKNENLEPLVLIHAASCGSTIWYPNIKSLSEKFCVYAIDLISEASKSILTLKMKNNQCATWLNEVVTELKLETFNLCGLSIGGWNAANYAITFPNKVKKLVLLSPVQTFSKMFKSFLFKILKMGFNPTRKNVENYIGWGSAKEKPLPESVIEQFRISVMNMNSNSVFPKMIKREKLKFLSMPVMVLLGKNEFAFNVKKAFSVAKQNINNIDIEIIDEASHLISVSAPNTVNEKLVNFLLN